MDTLEHIYNKYIDTTEPITHIDFSIYNNRDIVSNSAIEDPAGITSDEIEKDGVPVVGGVMDTRLGVVDRVPCGTCGETKSCPGHFGHIALVEPVYNIGFVEMVKKILRCICIRCKKILIDTDDPSVIASIGKLRGAARFNRVKDLCKNIAYCQGTNRKGCGAAVQKITIFKKGGSLFLTAEPDKKIDNTFKKNISRVIGSKLCSDILRGISDADCITMGFDPTKSRPEDMIIENFPIPPVQIRPPVREEFGGNRMDDLLHKLLDIVKKNESLRSARSDGSLSRDSSIDDNHMLLQYHAITYQANDVVGIPKSLMKNKKTTKSITERIKAKEGRIRGNLMGKRVDMSGRTVISSDPYIPLNGIGIPIIIAKTLTFPEIVHKKNIDRLRQAVTNGPTIYPGANYVISKTVDNYGNEKNRVTNLLHSKAVFKLQIGDVVERHLMDGDIVLFNRQPSLHKLSMMAHICHIIENDELRTFRVNVNVTDPYNADFDGDEMNIHVPQTIQTESELRLIANASKRFIHPGKSRVAINVKQDTILGAFIATNDKIGSDVGWRDLMNILMASETAQDFVIPKFSKFSGKFMVSALIPNLLNIFRYSDDGELKMKIKNGILHKGIAKKQSVGNIVQELWNQYGGSVTTVFMDDLHRVILQYLLHQGCTTGVGDAHANRKVVKSVYKIIESKRKETMNFITSYENDPYVMDSFVFECHITEDLKSIISDIQNIVMDNMLGQNSIYNTVNSGSSATMMHVGQISGCIGQVIVEKKRIPKKFNNRTIPCFSQHDDSPFARGFCHNSFIKGLSPAEFFFQSMAGREGTITSAIKTQETGYMQRKFVKFLEDLKVEYDVTTRNANDKIIQLAYGDNGISTERQVEQDIKLISAGDKTVREKYTYSKSELDRMRKKKIISDKYTDKCNEQLFNKLLQMRNNIRSLQIKFRFNVGIFRTKYTVPVDLQQKILDITCADGRNTKNIVDPFYVLKTIKNLYQGPSSKILLYGKDSIIKKYDDQKMRFISKLYLYDTLSPKRCTHEYKLSTEEFDELVEFYKKGVRLAKIDYGEMVGMLGAHSIGEPVTQTNLKAFHFSGSGKGAIAGLARVVEIAAVSKNIKAPYISVILESKYSKMKDIAIKISSHLKYTTLSDLASEVELHYDPGMDKNGVDRIFKGGKGKGGCQKNIKGLPWILVIKLSKEKMIVRNVKLLDIKSSICDNWVNRWSDGNIKKDAKIVYSKITKCAILSNYDNSPVPTIHVRCDASNYNFNTFIKFMDVILDTYKIKGIPGITESKNINEEKYDTFDDGGNVIKTTRFTIDAAGTNMIGLSQVNGIDLLQSYSNDIVSTYEMYGIEAARTLFIKEFTLAVESSNAITGYQHVELLADTVTHMGILIPVTRHGVKKMDTDTLSKASFEQTVDKFKDAAMYGESDFMRSVSSRIAAGEMINGGTGAFNILLDHEKLKNTLPKSASVEPMLELEKRDVLKDMIRKKKRRTNAK